MRTSKTLTLAAVATIVFFAGCEKTGARKAIYGTVTFRGAPLDSGSIAFLSASDGIQLGGVMIKDGKFTMPAEHGLEPGTYKVSISSPKGLAERTPAEIAAGGSPSAKEQIPPEYNMKTKLTIEVSAGGPNVFTLSIE
jgi:hypothetical protein